MSYAMDQVLASCYVCNTTITGNRFRWLLRSDNACERQVLNMHRGELLGLEKLDRNVRVCLACNSRCRQFLKDAGQLTGSPQIVVRDYGKKACVVCRNQVKTELAILGFPAQARVYHDTDIFIPFRSKCCFTHLDKGFLRREEYHRLRGTSQYLRLSQAQYDKWICYIEEERAKLLNVRKKLKFDKAPEFLKDRYRKTTHQLETPSVPPVDHLLNHAEGL